MSVEWSEELSIEIKEIDEQHKELFKRANNLISAMNKGKGREEVVDMIIFVRIHLL